MFFGVRFMKDIKIELNESVCEIEKTLGELLLNTDKDLCGIFDAMAYSTLGAGKRIRAYLVLEFCRIFGGDRSVALRYASALEMIHAFSLIHDDLPCMDDDDMRRGKPSCHKKFGEAQALIAGDALIMRAFEAVCTSDADPASNLLAVELLASRAGALGMCGGQMMDMYAEENEIDYEYLKKLQSLKTGALIECAAELGCICAGADGEKRENARRYAADIGRAFQIVDDMLDVLGDSETLGKNVGSDGENGKSTFVTFLGIDGAKKEAERLSESAKSYINKYPGTENLLSLADWLLIRQN